MKDVRGKFLGMRKEQEFTVYPYVEDQTHITVQSDRAIGMFEIETGKGLLNWRGSNPKYFIHLHESMGPEEFQFPKEFIEECLKVQPKPGDKLGGDSIIIY